jgi:uncharacterized protein YqjF (DUF2071 family)
MPATGSRTEPDLEGRLAERHRPDGPAIMYQRWEHLLFLHWRYTPDEIQATLPPGLTVDACDEFAWVGLVPIFMRQVRPRFVPAIPFVSDFLELNLRTYVYDRHGRPGVYFYSLDCDQPLVVEAARHLLHLRYEHAEMRGEVDARGAVTLDSQRRGTRAIDHFAYQAGAKSVEPLPGSLAFFLVERYRLFSSKGDDLMSVRVHHAPYRLNSATVGRWGGATFQLAGLASPRYEPDHVCAAEPVEVEVFSPEQVELGSMVQA